MSEPAEPPALEVCDLAFRHRSATDGALVIESVSFSVPRGSICVIAGPNGAGKSTLLRLIAGLLQPERGTVRIGGREPSHARIGYAWQSTAQSLFPWLSGIENAALPLRLKGVPRSEREEKVRALCAELEFDLPLERPPYEMSGGEQQKLCVVRALASDCELLLLDEPTASLSYESSVEVFDYLQRIPARRGIAVVIVTHSPDLAVLAADRVLPVRGTPLRIRPDDLQSIAGAPAHPRPLDWMHTAEFASHVRAVREQMSALP